MHGDDRRPRLAPTHEPLRHDVRYLGELLGDVLRDHGGDALFTRVESARHAAIGRRERNEPLDPLRVSLANLPVSEAAALVRAFSLYFSLTNLAEQTHRIRRRRDYAIEGTPQPGSLDAVFTAFDAGDRGLVVEALNRLRIMPVLTAHPTEAIRRTVLKKEQRIARALVDRIEKPQRTPIEDRRITERIRTEIGLIWETAEQASSRPTVADEVEHILFFLAEIVYRVVPAFHDALDAAAGPLAADHDPSVARAVLRFGSWVGGDMDGNPNVGADTILATLSRHRELILGEYRQEVRTLFEHLSQGETWGTISDEVRERARTYRDQFPEARVPERYADMPYRVLLWMIWHRLGVTLSQDPTDTPNPPSSRTT